MARLLRDVAFGEAPTIVPAPGGWDAASQFAFDRGRLAGRDEGYAEGFTAGRADLATIADRVLAAARVCSDQIVAAHTDLVARIIEVSELYVQAVVRHLPDAAPAGMLARIGEALAHLEPAELELQAPADVAVDLGRALAERSDGMRISVVADLGLRPGEYRIRSDWSQADGTWANYLDAARHAIETYLVEHVGLTEHPGCLAEHEG